MIYIVMYLFAIVIANVTVSIWGPQMVIVNAFLFIGLDLTARDKLHEKWNGEKLYLKMLALIVSGGILSYLVNNGVGRIAIASTVSFVLAGIADAIVYQFLFTKKKMIKINGSNVVSAAIDSVAFPTIAFGSFMPVIVVGQFIAKVLGGFVWSVIFNGIEKMKAKMAMAR